jgi:hypothetical protein
LLLGGIISIIILGLSLPIIQDSKNIYTALKKESITTLLEELEHKKILFIGEDHIIINEELFLAENLQKFYDTGVRYIFVESNPDLDIFIPGSKNYYFLLFYPWIIAGWKYETQSLQQAILAFNAKLPEADRIKILSPEPYINSMDIYKDILNYRDSNGAETIINIMDKTDNTVKALIFYGSGHANIKIEKNYINELSNIKYDWMPLAYRLKKHYEDNFASYRFAYIPNNIKKYVSESSFILTENIHAVKIINAIRKNPRYDGFIVEREGISGSFYQYNPTDENLQFILNMVEDYALYNQNAVPDTAYMPFDAQDQFLMGLYYLKLYFSDKFDYDFWKIGVSTTLITALASLKEYAFRQGTPSRFINLAYDHDDMLLYHT